MVADHISIGDFLSSGDFCFMDECNGVGTSDTVTNTIGTMAEFITKCSTPD